MEDSEPKRVNPTLDIIEVNSLRLGGLFIACSERRQLYIEIPKKKKKEIQWSECIKISEVGIKN